MVTKVSEEHRLQACYGVARAYLDTGGFRDVNAPLGEDGLHPYLWGVALLACIQDYVSASLGHGRFGRCQEKWGYPVPLEDREVPEDDEPAPGDVGC